MTARLPRRILGVSVAIALVASLAFVTSNPYAIADWLRLRNYTPPAEISQLATDTAMTEPAKHVFYINHPALQDKPAFRDSCPKYDNQTITIGCYVGGQRGIYILAVNDERLAGVEQVTAAHEMLHAAYERLDGTERSRIDSLLQAYADNGLRDQRVIDALKGYEKTEPGQQHNEMHSMFGTEIADLPAELETYYSRYFSNRQAVVAFAQNYQEAFKTRQVAIEAYDSRLKTQAEQIETNSQSLERQAASIEAQRNRLDSLSQSGDIQAYNNGVAPFNATVASYNALLNQTTELIRQYNELVKERNAIASQTVELQKAIDSSSLPDSQ